LLRSGGVDPHPGPGADAGSGAYDRRAAGARSGARSDPELDAALNLALDLADAADAVTLAHFRSRDLVVETKPDLTPVSEADRATEALLRERLAAACPSDAVLGEEYGSHGDPAGNRRRWILDPIDGTKSYVRGIPVYATLIALEVDGDVAVGVVSAPAIAQRWWARRGGGAFLNGEPVRTSEVGDLADAHLSFDSIDQFDDAGATERFLALERRCWRSRGFGDFWSHVMVADGSVDVAVEGPGLRYYDLAAPMIVVEEAGGRFTDLTGRRTARGGTALATNGLLHDAVLAALSP